MLDSIEFYQIIFLHASLVCIKVSNLNANILNNRKYITSFVPDFCDSFSLEKTIIPVTCIKLSIGSPFDIFLSIRLKKCFEHKFCHKPILTLFKAYIKKLPNENVKHRDFFENFN